MDSGYKEDDVQRTVERGTYDVAVENAALTEGLGMWRFSSLDERYLETLTHCLVRLYFPTAQALEDATAPGSIIHEPFKLGSEVPRGRCDHHRPSHHDHDRDLQISLGFGI